MNFRCYIAFLAATYAYGLAAAPEATEFGFILQ